MYRVTVNTGLRSTAVIPDRNEYSFAKDSKEKNKMALTKNELVEKITKIYEFLYENENLQNERDTRWKKLQNMKSNLSNSIESKKRSIVRVIVFGIIGGLLFLWQFNMTPWGFFEIVGQFLVRAGAVISGIISIINLVLMIEEIFDIKSYNLETIECQKQWDEIEEELKTFYSQKQQEINDIAVFFPGDDYPLSRHIQYGINCLTSGRADDFKEFMNLIDDLIHREKLEYEAQSQTENTRQQAEYARQAAANSAAALGAANRAASDAEKAASDAAAAKRNTNW
jgi:hypothetical protein